MVNEVPAAQAMGAVMVHGPEPAIESAPGVQVPAVAAVFVAVGAVQPTGTWRVTAEPDPKEVPLLFVKVNPSELVVEPAVTEVGATVMVPDPFGGVKVTAAEWLSTRFESVVSVAV
jgi:hypothetical protein